MKHKKIAALAMASALAVSVLASAAFAAAPASKADASSQETQTVRKHAKKPEAAEPENAVGKDAAKEKALADAGVTEEQAGKIRSRFSQPEDGAGVYKVRFTYDGKRYSYRIDATTGEVINKTAEAVTENTAGRSRGQGKHSAGTSDKTAGLSAGSSSASV